MTQHTPITHTHNSPSTLAENLFRHTAYQVALSMAEQHNEKWLHETGWGYEDSRTAQERLFACYELSSKKNIRVYDNVSGDCQWLVQIYTVSPGGRNILEERILPFTQVDIEVTVYPE